MQARLNTVISHKTWRNKGGGTDDSNQKSIEPASYETKMARSRPTRLKLPLDITGKSKNK